MKQCAIFTGGEIRNYNNIDISLLQDYFIIAADAGYLHAKKLGLKTNILIGDFDTLAEIPTDVDEVIKFPKEKDDTDTMLAIKLAIERGYDNIDIYGALGNRFDHTFANIQALAYIKEQKKCGRIISESDIVYLIENEEIIIPKKDGFSLSVFSYGEKCCGVSIEGVKYLLKNAIIYNSFPLGVCNEFSKEKAKISVKSGKMLIIISKK